MLWENVNYYIEQAYISINVHDIVEFIETSKHPWQQSFEFQLENDLTNPALSLSQFQQHFTSSFCAKVLSVFLCFCAFAFKYVGEIDPCSQFPQHFTSRYCADIPLPKNYKTKLWVEKSFAKTLSFKKSVCKMLVKLRPGVVATAKKDSKNNEK